MDSNVLQQIRHDLELVFPQGGYRLSWRAGKRLLLSLDDSVHPNMRRFSEEVVRLHGVPFEVDHHPRPSRRAG